MSQNALHQRLLVTGGAGFIGSALVRELGKRGVQCLVLDSLTYAGDRRNLGGFPGSDGVRLAVVDICDFQRVREEILQFRPDAILNLAAESHVDRSIAGAGEFIRTNVEGTYRMLECAAEYWRELDASAQKIFRYVQVSTDEVYGSLGESGAFSENSPIEPNSPYSATKAGADHLVRAWNHTFGLPTVVTRCTNNYGPRQFPEKMIPRMITAALAGERLPVYGDGQQIRDWIHVEDHVNGILLALERAPLGSVVCFGGRAEVRNLDLVHRICDLMDRMRPRASGSYRSLIASVADRPGHDRRYAMDDSKAERELGFTRVWNFERGLENTIQWYLSNEEWWRAHLAPPAHSVKRSTQ